MGKAWWLVVLGAGLWAEAIPPTQGETLGGTKVSLPAALQGRQGILVLGFSRKSSVETKGWADALERDFANDARTICYAMPVLEEVPGMIRGMVIGSIRKPLSAKQRGHYLPVLQNEAAWKKVVGYGAADAAYVVLIDAGGQVKWKTQGPFREAAYKELRELTR